MDTEINSFGNLGLVSSSLIRGWAIIDAPDIVPEVVIQADGRELCRARADLFRQDLLDNGLHPTGCCGFEAREFDRRQLQNAREIRAFIAQTRKELAHSPTPLKNKMSAYEDLDYRPLISIHVPKTAGTSFRIAAQHYFGEEHVLRDYEENSPATSKILLDTVYNGRREFLVSELVNNRIRFFTGHFNARKYLDILDAQVRWCVFLRDPVQRVISEYRHRVRHSGYRKPLEHFCRVEGHRNLQHKCVKGLDLARCFVGITEHYDQSLDLFKASEGHAFEKLKLNINTQPTKGLQPDEESYRKLAELIEENNPLDMELYAKARQLFKRRLEEHRLPPVG